MAFLTKGDLASIAKNKSGNDLSKGNTNEFRKFSKSSSVTSIFLSHSHEDAVLVKQAKVFFENLGISIYVDWADDTMPENTSGITAQKIKNQIILQNDKFIFLATNTAILSKWCNWEIGIADPFKLTSKKMAILPLADNNGSWMGNEYLQIYPRIERNLRRVGGEGYYIWYPDQSWETIEDWLKK